MIDERAFRRVLISIGVIVALGLIAHLILLLWAQHDFTPVEALVALHANMLSHGEGIYYDLNRYPFTVSPYGPIFYGASAALRSLGVPLYQSARSISFVALLGGLCLLWRGSGFLIEDRNARLASVILAASTANLLFWGTVGQVDMLACCLSLGSFVVFLQYRSERRTAFLVVSGVLVVAAIFTKQTSLAAGAAISGSLMIENRKRALWWMAGVAAATAGLALTLNHLTSGHYFADAIFANMNPFSAIKLQQQAQYLLLTGAGVIIVAAIGSRLEPLYLYAATATLVWLLTASKIGSDLNYQIELMMILTLCAACTLDRVRFFPKILSGDRTWVTLLQIPLMLHVVLNGVLTTRIVVERALLEPEKRAETAALKPFVERGRVLSVQYDSLVQFRGYIEVEPLIYTLLVEAGRSDPGPVLRDLAQGRFQSIILRENVFSPTPAWDNPETTALPIAQRNEIRRSYRLARHIAGPYLEGVYVYEPVIK